MSSSSTANNINALLEPFLFQVIGSNPTTVKDALVKSGISGKPGAGAQLAAVVFFAAAVNKTALETFTANPALAEVRPYLTSALTINGRMNMTAMTMLGHCLLTSDEAKGITFAAEFRKKMGQDNIWEGDLSKGSLSEKQMKILKEKASIVKLEDARCLGRGFWKYCGISNAPMTQEEANFWGIPLAAPEQGQAFERGTSTAANSPPRRTARAEKGKGRGQQYATYGIQTGEDVRVPAELAEWYKTHIGGDDNDVAGSIARNGVEEWISKYRQAMEADPDGTRAFGSTVVQ